GDIPRTTSQGTVTVIDSGVSVINGAVTFESAPLCGQFRVAVVCTTGSSGVATDRMNPINPAMAATQRATLSSRRTWPARDGSRSVFANMSDEPLGRRASEPVMAAL